MSDETKVVDPTAESLANLKAEMTRKLGNSDTRLAELQKSNELLMAKLDSMSRPKAAPQETSMSDLLYSDPARYAELIAERTNKTVMENVSRQQEKLVKVNTTIQQIAADFPEVADASHPLTKRAVEIYNSLPEEERQSSLSYKHAIREAAEELSIKPKSKRPVDEEPSFGGGSGSGVRVRKTEKLDKDVETLAGIFGIDTSDANVKSRLISSQNRKWSKFEPIKRSK